MGWRLLGRIKQDSKRKYSKNKLPFEVIDTAETQKEASILFKQYCEAYGLYWDFKLERY